MERRCVNVADEYAPPPTPKKPQRDPAGSDGNKAAGHIPTLWLLVLVVGSSWMSTAQRPLV